MAIIKSSSFGLAMAVLLMVASSSSSSSVDGASIRGSSTMTNTNNHKKQFLRHSEPSEVVDEDRRHLKSDKKSKNGSSYVQAGTTSFTTTTAPAPTNAPGPSYDDWVNECYRHSNDVNSCKTNPDPNNWCGLCLRALTTVGSSSTNYDSGLRNCANTSCIGCDVETLKPFFNCGLVVEGKAPLEVDGETNSLPSSSTETSTGTSTIPATDNNSQPEPLPALADPKIDYINCPAVFPGSKAPCVIDDSFEFKECNYYERGPNARCGCSSVQPVWACTGVTVFDPIVVEVVEQEDLSVSFQEEEEQIIENEETGEDSIGSIDESLPVIPIDVEVNQYPVALLCPSTVPETGDMCTTGGFDSIECCFTDDTSNEIDATITCECTIVGTFNPTFTCTSGVESTCTV